MNNTLPQIPPSSANLTMQHCCRIAGRLGMLLALGCFCVTGVLLYSAHEKRSTWIPTSGQVVELVESEGSGGETLYSPVFQFSAPDGSVHRNKSDWASRPAAFSVGEWVEMIHPADAPGKARVNTFMSFYFWPCLCAFFGCLFTGAACFIFILGRVLRKHPSL